MSAKKPPPKKRPPHAGKGKPISHLEIDKACSLIALGHTISQIADELGRSPSGLNRVLLESYPEEYEAAKERRRDLIRKERWTRAFQRDDRWSAKFLDDLAMEQLPEAREARKSVNAPSPEDERTDRIAEALERFTVAVLSRATTGPAALTPGGTE